MTSLNENIFRVTGPLCGNSPVTGEFPSQRPVTRSFDVFFDMRIGCDVLDVIFVFVLFIAYFVRNDEIKMFNQSLNKQLSKQLWDWWFETPFCSLWRHCNAGYWVSVGYADRSQFWTSVLTNMAFNLELLSHPGIPGVTLCFCTGSYAAAGAAAAAAAGRRFLSTR